MINMDEPSDGKETEESLIQPVCYTDTTDIQRSNFRAISDSKVWARPNAKQLEEIRTNQFKGVSIWSSEGRLVLAEKVETIVYKSGLPYNVSYEYRAILSDDLPMCD